MQDGTTKKKYSEFDKYFETSTQNKYSKFDKYFPKQDNTPNAVFPQKTNNYQKNVRIPSVTENALNQYFGDPLTAEGQTQQKELGLSDQVKNIVYDIARKNVQPEQVSNYLTTKNNKYKINPGEMITFPETVITGDQKTARPLAEIPLTETQRKIGTKIPVPSIKDAYSSERERLNNVLNAIQNTPTEIAKQGSQYLTGKFNQLITPAAEVNKNIYNLPKNPIANTIGLVTNIGHTLFSPISTGFSVVNDILTSLPSIQISKDISLGGKEIAQAINLPFELLANAPKKGEELIGKTGIVPDNSKIAESLGVEKKTIDDITSKISDFNSLATTLIGLKIAHTTKNKILGKDITLEESMELGRKALNKINNQLAAPDFIGRLSQKYIKPIAKEPTPNITETNLTKEGIEYFKQRLNDPALSPNEKQITLDYLVKQGISPEELNINAEKSTPLKGVIPEKLAEPSKLQNVETGGQNAETIRRNQEILSQEGDVGRPSPIDSGGNIQQITPGEVTRQLPRSESQNAPEITQGIKEIVPGQIREPQQTGTQVVQNEYPEFDKYLPENKTPEDISKALNVPIEKVNKPIKKPIEDYEFTKEKINEGQARFDLHRALNFPLGKSYKLTSDNSLVRIKEHTPNWSNFAEDLYANPDIKKVINVTVGDLENVDFRKDKTSLNAIKKEFPNVEFVDIMIPEGTNYSEALTKINKELSMQESLAQKIPKIEQSVRETPKVENVEQKPLETQPIENIEKLPKESSLTIEAKKYKSAEDFIKQVSFSPARDSKDRGVIRRFLSKETTIEPIDILELDKNNPKIDNSTVKTYEQMIEGGERPFLLIDGNRVIDGHHKLQAYKNLGFDEVPTISKKQLTDIWDSANQPQGKPKTSILKKNMPQTPEGEIILYHGSDNPNFELKDNIHLGSKEQANMRNNKNVTAYTTNIKPSELSRSKDAGGQWNNKIKVAKKSGKKGIVYLNRYEGITTERIQELDKLGLLDKLDSMSDAEFKKYVPEAKDSYIIFDKNNLKQYKEDSQSQQLPSKDRIVEPTEATKLAQGASVSKEPYEMTQKEYHDYTINVEGGHVDFGNVGAVNSAHKFLIKEAIEEGKIIPKAVLKDYPDLAEKYKAEQPTGSTTKYIGMKNLSNESVTNFFDNQKSIDKIFSFRNSRRNENLSPNDKRATHREIQKEIVNLRTQGLDVKYENDNLYIDGQKIYPKTITQAEDLNKIQIENEDASVPFEVLPQEEVDRQNFLVNAFSEKKYLPEELQRMLPSGFGQLKINNAAKDIQENGGKEQSRDAKILRDFVKNIDDVLQRDGYITMSNGQRLTKSDLDVEFEDYVYKQAKAQTKFGDTSFEFSLDDEIVNEAINETSAKEIVTNSDTTELEKLAEDIESKAASNKEVELNEAIRQADELILTEPPTKQVKKKATEESFLSSEMSKPVFRTDVGKTSKKDVGEEGSPLFNQEISDKDQQALFQQLGDRTELQNLQDRKRHLQLVIENPKSTGTTITEAKRELQDINRKLGKINSKESQFDMFGDAQDQQSLFQEHSRIRSVFEKMSSTEQKKFLDEIAKGVSNDWTIEKKSLSKEQAAGVTLLLKNAINYDPKTADFTTAWEESLHASVIALAKPYLAKNMLRKNGWNGKGEIWDVANNDTLRNAHEKLANKYIDWRTEQEGNPTEPKTRLEKFFQSLRELWSKIASFLNRLGLRTQSGYFYDLATGKLKKNTEKINDIDVQTETAFAQNIKSTRQKLEKKFPEITQALFQKLPEESFKQRMEKNRNRPPSDDEQLSMKVDDNKIQLPPETILQLIQRKLQDKENRLSQLVKAGEKVGNVEENIDSYLQSELYIGRVTDQIEKLEGKIINGKTGLLDKMEESNISIDDMGEYLYAKHAKERNDAIYEKNGKEGGSGLNDDEIQPILDKYNGTPIEQYAKEFRKIIIEPMLELAHDSGLLTDEKYENLKEFYTDYVPLKGIDKPVQTFTQRLRGKGYSVSSTGIIQAKGRSSIANNPFVQAIMDYEDTIIRAEKNKVGLSFLDFVKEFPNKDLYEVRGAKYMPEYDKYGEEIGMRKLDQRLADDEFSVWEYGKQKIITIKDEALLSGLKNLGAERSIPILSAANNYMRSVATVLNPEFILTNFERDLQTALINIGGEQSSKMAKDVVKDIPKAWKGIWKGIRDKESNQWTKEFDEYKSVGAKTGWISQNDIEQKTKHLENLIKNYSKERNFAYRVSKSSLDLINNLNNTVENGVRLSAYVNAKKMGLSPQKAASLAKNLTVNFNKKGEWGALLNSLYLFSNAGIQGSARILKALKYPRVRKIGYALVGMAVLQGIINRIVDEDDSYEKMPTWYKDTNWVFMIPGTGKHIKIKLPYGFNLFNVLGNVLTDTGYNITEGNGAQIGTGISRIFSGVEDAFNPLGASGSLSQLVAPSFIDPFIQLAENKTFTGAPIRKEQPMFQPKKPNSQMYFKNVNPYAKDFTTWLNNVSGGDSVKSGKVDINPEDIEFVANFIGGGTGKFITNTLTTGTSLATEGKFPEIRNTPFVRGVIGENKTQGTDLRWVYEMVSESARNEFTKKEKDDFNKTILRLYKNKEIDDKQYSRLSNQFNKETESNKIKPFPTLGKSMNKKLGVGF